MLVLALLLGGAIGAPARYVIDELVKERYPGVFPWGTFLINVTGSLILGVITGLALYHGLGNVPRTAIGVGFCGAFTTFSTFSYETVRLVETDAIGPAFANALGSVVAGLAAAALGLALMAAV
jgi:fluoride exporter